MTTAQQNLIDALAARRITGSFNGRFLNCKTPVKSTKKVKWQKFGIIFDGAGSLDGPRACQGGKGAYCEHYQRVGFYEAIRIGQGQEAADKFHAECKEGGVYSGAPMAT